MPRGFAGLRESGQWHLVRSGPNRECLIDSIYGDPRNTGRSSIGREPDFLEWKLQSVGEGRSQLPITCRCEVDSIASKPFRVCEDPETLAVTISY